MPVKLVKPVFDLYFFIGKYRIKYVKTIPECIKAFF